MFYKEMYEEQEKGRTIHMGIFIHLEVSKSVTEEEWENVYEETLALVKAFHWQSGEKSHAGGLRRFALYRL